MHTPTFRAARLLGAAACVTALGLATACGGASAPPAPPAAAPAAPVSDAAAGGHGAAGHGGAHGHNVGPGGVELYAVQTATLGDVVTDGSGRLLYGSDGDANNPPTARCADACAQRWHPLVVPAGQEPVLLGVAPEKVGRVARADGASQLTLSGWPLYVNSDDDGGLKATAPDARGAWFVLTPQGRRVPV